MPKLNLLDATRPLRLQYDATKVVDFVVSSLGGLTVTPMSGQAITIGGNVLFPDATHDIGASGATRPRDLFLSRNLVVGGTITGTLAAGAQTGITSVGSLSTLTVSGAVTGGTYNGQTISSVANFTGSVAVAGEIVANTLIRRTANNSYLSLYGGLTASESSAAGMYLFGNTEAANPGRIFIDTGAVSGAYIRFAANGVEAVRIESTAVTINTDLLPLTGIIRRSTADGADTGFMGIYGGGAGADTRGGLVEAYGNENGSRPGQVVLRAGNIAGASIQFVGLGTLWGKLEAGIFAWGTSTLTNAVAGDARLSGKLWIADGVTAPTAQTGFAAIYVDAADGDLKVKFADGVTKTISVDT